METKTQIVKLSKFDKLTKSVNKALTTENAYIKLLGVSANAKIQECTLSKVVSTFLSHSVVNGIDLLTENQKLHLTFENVLKFVKSSDKFKGVTMFSLHNVVLICNSILKSHDTLTKISVKLAKQGGQVTTKKVVKK
jgi:hypothetical protein